MLCVNKKLYEERNIYSFIQASVLQLNRQNPYLIYKKEYRLFYYIAEDFCANMNFLSNYDITMDAFGFPVIKKNTRNAIEAFLDLYNLCCDDMYIDVLMYNAKKKKRDELKKYKSYLKRKDDNNQYHWADYFSIPDKSRIARELYNGEFQDYVDLSKESNSFVHPNVFLNVVSSVEKNKDLKKFLIANVELLSRAYELLLEKYNSSNQPYLNCAHNHYCTRNCSECYKKEINNFTFIVSNELFEEKNSFYGYC